jgi:ubiquinone/menaquinone biosynthesis C-methylase UbiE
MSFLEKEGTNQFTFEAFASHPFYTEINRSLVRQALAHLDTHPTGSPLTIVDMACGTGAITRLIAEELASQGRQVRLVAVDPSEDALRHARKGMEDSGRVRIQVDFYQGEAADLPALVRDADAAFFCNAIHLVNDKRATFRQMANILAPGGIFACNSAFFMGTNIENTQTLRFSRLWIRRAVQWLRKAHPEVQLSREKAVAMQWLTPQEYSCLIEEEGFCDVETVQEQVMMSLDSMRDLGNYWLFIEGALPGAPLALGAAALSATVYQASEELGMIEVPRMWLQINARKC